MDCSECKRILLQQGCKDKAAVTDILEDKCNEDWCKICQNLVCLPAEFPLDIFADVEHSLFDIS